jgi:hypothetical protein
MSWYPGKDQELENRPGTAGEELNMRTRWFAWVA